jgi:hypothetical protein
MSTKNETCGVFLNDVPMEKSLKIIQVWKQKVIKFLKMKKKNENELLKVTSSNN